MDISDKKRKWSIRLIVLGIGILIVSAILLFILSFYPSTYLNIAMANVFVVPCIWGAVLLVSGLAIRKQGAASKITLAFMLVLVGVTTMNSPFITSLQDVRAIMNDELYITEGTVTDTYIKRKTSSTRRGSSGSVSYHQYFTLDNDVSDTFMVIVDDMEDYRLTLGGEYRIVALPHSKQMLEYQEIKERR